MRRWGLLAASLIALLATGCTDADVARAENTRPGADPTTAPPTQPAPPIRDQPVGIEMRNVRLHVSEEAVLGVRWLKGRLLTTAQGQPPVFDDQRSFSMEIEDSEMRVDAGSLTALVNRMATYKGSSLSDLSVSFEGGFIRQHGKLHKGIAVPFDVKASIEATADGRIRLHPVKVKAAGIPTTKLMSLFHIELDELIKDAASRGFVVKDNDLYLAPTRMLPAPETRGALTRAFVEKNRLVLIFGRGHASEPARRGRSSNYIWFRGGQIRFGKLLMTDADLQLIDSDPKDPFDFFSARYEDQLVAGYSKNTRQRGLRTYMPDYDSLGSSRRDVAQ
jgi:hypothetical protein